MKHLLLITSLYILLSNTIYCQDTVGGVIWYPPVHISGPIIEGLGAFMPHIASVGDDTLYVVWKTAGVGQNIRLPFRRSVDGGRTWEPLRDLMTDTITYKFPCHRPTVVAERNNVYVFFVYNTTSILDSVKLRLMSSSDYGVTWTTPRMISPESIGFLNAETISKDSIAVIPARIYNSNDGIFVSSNRGTTWNYTSSFYYENYATVALSPGNLHLAKQTRVGLADEIEYRRSTNLGRTWIYDTIVSTPDNYYSDIASIAATQTNSGTEVLVAWRDTKYGVCGFAGASIISRSGLFNGTQWVPEVRLTQKPNGFEPKTAINKNSKAVAWTVEYNCLDTFHYAVRGTNSSLKKFEPLVDLSLNEWIAGSPDIAVSSTAIHVVAIQQIVVHGEFKIMYRRGEFLPSDVEFLLSSNSVYFDTAITGETTSQKLTICNSGKDTLCIDTTLSNNPCFAVLFPNTKIPPFDSVQATVQFTPNNQVATTGRILFYHNALSSPDYIDVTGTGKWNKKTIGYNTGWQIVSTPLILGPSQSLPSLYEFSDGYHPVTTMKFGNGYWAKPPDTVTYRGSETVIDSINVTQGWNLIGALSEPSAVGSITTNPVSIIISPFYAFDRETGYSATELLQPGMGYWVKASANGTVVLNSRTMSRVQR